MKFLKFDLPKNHNLFLVSDLHEGTCLKYKKGVQKMINHVLSEEDNYVVIGGDLVEAITIDDKRYDPQVIKDNIGVPLLQYQAAVKELLPIKERILCVMMGNHDWKMTQKIGNFIKDFVCKELDAKYGTYTIHMTVKNQYKLFYTHGKGTLNSYAKDYDQETANMKAFLKKRLQKKFADTEIMAMAHTHKLLVREPAEFLYLSEKDGDAHQNYTKMVRTDKYIPSDFRWFCATGSFLKLFEDGISGYAERMMYDPVELGYIVVNVKNGKINNVQKVVV